MLQNCGTRVQLISQALAQGACASLRKYDYVQHGQGLRWHQANQYKVSADK